ncbi:hypothetical protein [Myroides odoratimimus]|uniref:Uncharacterized protein n=1 Tax=Myroides odoratimimus CIP 101113 TaxID=883154 RepID=A0AAV3F505_9FLAO|nr:hypothetical protein [Myroides odoratimimus]EHO13851.1 hypothetical protein HMPREF9715_00925 [Myroides odoratimimus CIP 101113]
MIYVLMNEKTAVDKGIIPASHPYQSNGEEVIFKKDILTTSGIHVPEEEYTPMTTADALKKYDEWQI